MPTADGGWTLPIYRLLQGQAFEPEHCQAMGEAFEQALAKLGLKDRSDPLCDMVAKKIIELGQQGERDVSRIRDLAVRTFSD